MSKIEVRIDGTAYKGWKTLSLVRSIEVLAGRFSMEVTDKRPFPIPKGGAVQVLLHDQVILTGYTDEIEVDIDSESHTLFLSGRDKTADMVDCSALIPSQEMLNVTLREIIEALAEPFGIKTIFDVDPPEIFKKFSFQEESAFEAIDRACRLRGVFATSNEFGDVTVQEYGGVRAGEGLTMGENILSARSKNLEKDRFSEYRVYGQQPEDDNITPEAATTPEGLATDQGVTRFRPKIILAEGATSPEIAQKRAEWEASVRAARSNTLEVTVQCWNDNSGKLWRENSLVPCLLPQHNIKDDMLIKEVSFSLDDKRGEQSRLVLVRPDAYELQPDLPKESEAESE